MYLKECALNLLPERVETMKYTLLSEKKIYNLIEKKNQQNKKINKLKKNQTEKVSVLCNDKAHPKERRQYEYCTCIKFPLLYGIF